MGRERSWRIRTVRLEFHHPPGHGRDKAVRDKLSAVTAAGEYLWFGTDEGTALDRLRADGLDRYAEHHSFDLSEYLKLPLPAGKKGEIDIEGLDIADGYLWVVGSHARTRDKADPKADGPEKAIAGLEDTDPNPNRRMLARIPLVNGNGTGSRLSKVGDGGRAVAQLGATEQSSALVDALAGDKHVAPFLALPAKENGFDVEGLAVRGKRVFLGLRGPVLRGWAMLLEMKVKTAGDALELRPVGPGGRRYRKHFLELEGCGMRDLCLSGDREELLILAGPTMALDGTVRVHRWALPGGEADTITTAVKCPALLEVPHRRGGDRAEGMVLMPGARGAELLVVYDSPASDRKHGPGAVDADIFALPD